MYIAILCKLTNANGVYVYCTLDCNIHASPNLNGIVLSMSKFAYERFSDDTFPYRFTRRSTFLPLVCYSSILMECSKNSVIDIAMSVSH